MHDKCIQNHIQIARTLIATVATQISSNYNIGRENHIWKGMHEEIGDNKSNIRMWPRLSIYCKYINSIMDTL